MTFSTLVSIIIPVYNEPELQSQVSALIQSQNHPDIEVILIDGSPLGNSIQDLKVPRVQTLISPEQGRGQQMNWGAAHATGEILLFLHADTLLPPRALNQIVQCLQTKPNLAGGAFDLKIQAPGLAFRLIEKVSSWRSRITRLPYGDQAWFLRHSVFKDIGGFAALPLMEDVDLGQRLKQKKLPICILTPPVKTSPRRWKKEGVVYTTLRNWTLLS